MNFYIFFITIVLVVTNGIKGDNHDRCKRQTANNTCFLLPQATQGPYYWNATYNRQNIIENSTGIPLTLYITVIEVDTCQPIPKAAIDIWHCDAAGIYSHFVNASMSDNGGGPPGMNGTRPPGPPPGMNGTGPPGGGNRITDNSTFLRGLQVTGNNGQATFFTIYPGWYPGRATHMHIKVHINGTYVDASGVYTGGHTSHTGQIFFHDSFTDQIALLAPYSSRNITRVLNNVDGVYNLQGGSYAVVSVTSIQENLGPQGGLVGYITLGVNSSAMPALVGGAGGQVTSTSTLELTSTLKSKGNAVTMMNFTLVLFHLIFLCLYSI